MVYSRSGEEPWRKRSGSPSAVMKHSSRRSVSLVRGGLRVADLMPATTPCNQRVFFRPFRSSGSCFAIMTAPAPAAVL